MANIAQITPTLSTGTVLTYTACAAGGDTIPTQSNLLIQNASAGSLTVTVASPTTCSQGGTHNLSIAVAAATTRVVGPLGARFDNGSGLVNLTYSGVTSLSVAALPAPIT